MLPAMPAPPPGDKPPPVAADHRAHLWQQFALRCIRGMTDADGIGEKGAAGGTQSGAGGTQSGAGEKGAAAAGGTQNGGVHAHAPPPVALQLASLPPWQLHAVPGEVHEWDGQPNGNPQVPCTPSVWGNGVVAIHLLYAPDLTAVCDQLAVVNAMPVGLCVRSQRSGQHAGEPMSTPPSNAHMLPRCVGVGIVRSVDPARGLLFVLTDVPEEVLQTVDCILGGRLELPHALLTCCDTSSIAGGGGRLGRHAAATAGAAAHRTGQRTKEQRTSGVSPAVRMVHSPYIAAFCVTADGTGGRAIRSRNNLVRLGGDGGV